MLDRFLSTAGETWRLIDRNRNHILLQGFFSVLTLLIIALVVVLTINTNYLLEIFKTRDLSWNMLRTLIPYIDRLDSFRYINYLFLSTAITLLLYTGFYYYRFYFASYREEVVLIFKLKGEKKLVLRPLLLMAFLICTGEVIVAWVLSGIVYSTFYRLIVQDYLRLALLGFNHFRISLLIILTLSSIGSTLPAVYFLFWREMKMIENSQ